MECCPNERTYERNAPKGQFFDVGDIDALGDLGMTVPQINFHTFRNRTYRKVSLPATSFTAPQFYKGDYPKFPLKPREAQMTTAGMAFYPLLAGNPSVEAGEEKEIADIRECGFVRGFHVPNLEIQKQIISKYWPARKQKDAIATETSQKNFISRMRSRFGGMSFAEERGVYLPKGELYTNENRLQNADEALDMWDVRYNKDHAKSLGLASRSSTGAW